MIIEVLIATAVTISQPVVKSSPATPKVVHLGQTIPSRSIQKPVVVKLGSGK